MLLGTNDRSALAAARSFSAAKIRCDLARLNTCSIAEWSRAVTHVYSPPFYDSRLCTLERYLDSITSAESYELLVPCDDIACELLTSMRSKLEGKVRLALPPASAYETAHDKSKTLELGRKLGIPVPPSRLVRDMAQAHDLLKHGLNFPLYLKPVFSAQVLDGYLAKYSVRKARNCEDYLDFMRAHVHALPILVQEECHGTGVGVYLLAQHGQILQMVEQQRLHEPLDGGGSSSRLARAVAPHLAQYARNIAAELGWHGVAMVEFKQAPDSQHIHLMEINPRLWGSLALSIRAGFDFPLWLYQLLVEDNPKCVPATEIHLPIRQRHLRKDLGWWGRKLWRDFSARNLEHCSAELLRVALGKEYLDNERWWDPLPSVLEWLPVQFSLRVARRAAAFLRYRRGESRARATALKLLKQPHTKVLVLCRGNIQRSAFAQAYMTQKLGYAQVRSAGFLALPRRAVPYELERYGLTHYGVDLRSHRSGVVDRELVEWADLVILMDYQNLVQLKQSALDFKPSVLLGSLSHSGAVRDPWGTSPAALQSCIDRIADILDRVKEWSTQ